MSKLNPPHKMTMEDVVQADIDYLIKLLLDSRDYLNGFSWHKASSIMKRDEVERYTMEIAG